MKFKKFDIVTVNEVVQIMQKLIDRGVLTRDINKLHMHHTYIPNHSHFESNLKKYGNRAYKIMQESMERSHRARGFDNVGDNVVDGKGTDFGYKTTYGVHLTLFPNCMIGIGRDFNEAPCSISGYNEHGLACEIIGNFDKGSDKFEGVQKETFLKLFNGLSKVLGLKIEDALMLHSEKSHKTCPGTSIVKGEILKDLKKEENMNKIDIKFNCDSKIIKCVDGDTIEKVEKYLSTFNIVQPIIPLYEYCGYDIKLTFKRSDEAKKLQTILNKFNAQLEVDGYFGNGSVAGLYAVTGSRVCTRAVAEQFNTLLVELESVAVEPETPVDLDEFDQDELEEKLEIEKFDKFTPFIKLRSKIYPNGKFGQSKPVQHMLNEVGGFGLTLDGRFGNKSVNALKTYKSSRGLSISGIVDKVVWKWLHFDHAEIQSKQNVLINWYDQQTKIMRVRKNDVELDVLLCKQPSEYPTSVYRRLDKKPLLLFNGGLFGTKNGVTLGYLKDGGKLITEGTYSKWVIGTDNLGNIDMFGMNWEKQNNNDSNIVDCIGASPSLVVSGKRNVDKTGLDYGFINSKHPRLCLGLDEEFIYVIIVHGRKSSKGYYGATIEELVDIGLDLNIEDLINLDGGGSIICLGVNEEGKAVRLDDNKGNRKVDNCVTLYLK